METNRFQLVADGKGIALTVWRRLVRHSPLTARSSVHTSGKKRRRSGRGLRVEQEKERFSTQRKPVLDAIRVVARGGITFETGGADAPWNQVEARGDQTEPILSERQREVLALVALGYSNKQIAERMYLSTRTVKRHMTDVLKALGVPDRASAAVTSRRRGLID